jgi:hypothetical protein
MGFALFIVFSVILSPLNNKSSRCKGSNSKSTVKPSSSSVLKRREKRTWKRHVLEEVSMLKLAQAFRKASVYKY